MKVSDTSIYLEAAAIEKDCPVTIKSVRAIGAKDIGTDGKPMSEKSMVISYEGASKEHVACRTVQKQIRAIHGNDADKWAGKKIILYQDSCQAFGKKVQCIRVRNIDPATGKAPEAF